MAKSKKNPETEDQELHKIIFKKLADSGIDIEEICGTDLESATTKMVCISSDMGETFQEISGKPRGETVMVRLDEETRETLDAWVDTDYFKSRSEAAALFIREGLKVRSAELEKLKEALSAVEKAKKDLHDKTRQILGDKNPS